MFVHQLLRASKAEVSEELENIGDGHVDESVLIMIDYAYHSHEPNYDYGLSFLDRIAAKIGRFHPNWDIQEMKQQIRDSDNPEEEYIKIIIKMFEKPGMFAYYGV